MRGLVVAKGVRDALVGVSVAIDAVPAGETDVTGRFDIELDQGGHRLLLQFPGYDPLEVAADVGPDGAAGGVPERTFRLVPRQSGERYESVIIAPDLQAPKTSLRGAEITRTPGSFGDPFRTIESLPGVSQVVWPLSIYAIRGANPGNTGFIVDGVRLPGLFHFALGPSVIHPFFLQQIDFYPGGYPARYGRYISGIVAARTQTPGTDRVHASADARLFDAGGIVAAPWDEGRGAVAVAGRYSYTGLLFSNLQKNADLGYWDYQARAHHTLGPGRVTAFAFGSSDELALNLDDGRQVARSQFHRLDLRWDGVLAGGRVTVAAVGGRDTSAASIKQLNNLPIRAQGWSFAPRAGYLRPLASWLDAEAGVDGEVQWFRPHSDRPDVEQQDLFRQRRVLSGGGYLTMEARAGSRLVVSPGMRVDAFVEKGITKYEPEPRLQVRFRPGGDVWLKATAGRFAQMASLPVSIPGFEGFGLDEFGTQTSLQGSSGVEVGLGEYLSVDATGFFQRLRLTDLRSTFATDITKEDLLEVRDGESYGAELLIRRPSRHRLNGWIAYTLSWSQRLVEGQLVPSDWDQRHILNVVGSYRFDRGWSAGARVHYNTGRPYPVYDQRSTRVDYMRIPDFYQLDLRGDKRFVFDRYVLDVYLELVNTTLTRQIVDIKRTPDGTLDRKGFRIVLPSIGVHAEW